MHTVYTRGVAPDSATLHIYLSGDGTPFLDPHHVSDDPTPRRPLALELMLADPTPALYIGRPCYEGRATEAGCSPALWSQARYSEAVVASMSAAVASLAAGAPRARVTLIGYSGGGVLAVLIAQRLPRIGQVVTIGANLDIDGWTRLHGYSALAGSLNPAAFTAWRSTLAQIHFVGAKDRNVPSTLVVAFAASVPTAQVRIIDGFDHRCCWVEQWPRLLKTIAEND